jgi:hypothetical protein
MQMLKINTFSALFYKFLEEADPFTAVPSRNIYVVAVSGNEWLLPTDSKNSTGTVFSKVVESLTLYMKVIICSLTVSDTTVVIDGLNRPVNNDSEDLTEPEGHGWAIQQPLPSRGHLYEDVFSALYGSPSAIVVLYDGSQVNKTSNLLTLLELEFSGYFLNVTSSFVYNTLQELEDNFMRTTSMSIVCLGQYFGYQNLPQYVESPPTTAELSHEPLECREVTQAGWHPLPTVATLQKPVLRARMKISSLFVLLGLAASIIFFVSALILLGSPPPIGEMLVGGQYSFS